MDINKKLDLIIEKITNIEVQTAVQQETINTFRGYFKFVGTVLGGLCITVGGGIIMALIMLV